MKTQISDNPVQIVIPSSIMRTPKNTGAVMWRDNQVEESQIVEESQVMEESQVVEESQLTEENFYSWNAQEDTFQETNTAAAVSLDDDVISVYSNMSTTESQSSTVPPPDKFYTKKKAAIEQVHGIIKSTATKINSVCDTIGINLTQPARAPSIEEDPA